MDFVRLIEGSDKPNVQVDPDTKARLVKWLQEHHDPNQKKIVSRVLTWFLDAPDSTQEMVLNIAPRDMRAEYARFYR